MPATASATTASTFAPTRWSPGTILPNFTGGVYTTLDYKNLSFYALVDFQDGGSLHSYSNQ